MINTLLVGLLGLLSLVLFPFSQSFWILFSGLMLAQIKIQDTFWRRQRFLWFTGLIAACMVLIANYLATHVFLLAAFLFTTTFFSAYYGRLKIDYLVPALIVNTLAVVSGGLMVPDDQGHIRFLAVIIAVALVAIVRCLTWPFTLKKELSNLFKESLRAINQLQQTIFSLYLKRDYTERHYFYEKELHDSRFVIFSVLNRLRILIGKLNSSQKIKYQTRLDQLDNLFELIDSLASLRFREKDLATLEVTEKEFREVSNHIEAAIHKIIKKEHVDSQEYSFNELELLFQQTLQVVSNEPFVYLVFIHDVKKIFNLLAMLSKDMRFE
jgi:hypothetical protein